MSAMRLIRATLLAMRNRGTGSIADVALVASGVMGGNQTATGTHEAAPTRLNKSMARAIISDGIRRNALRPGTTTLPPVENRIAATADSEAKRRNFTQGQPVNRFSLGEVVATLPLWTASSETGFMVGAIVTVDDGQTL